MRNNKDKQLLKHILDYCDQIEQAVNRIETIENLYMDQFYRNALSMPFVQIGELVRILSDDLKQEYHDVPWVEIKALRNHLIHSYGLIDWDVVWDAAKNDIPVLKKKCQSIISDLKIPIEIFCETHSGDHIQNEAIREDWQKYLPRITERVMRIATEQSREEAFWEMMGKWLREQHSRADVDQAIREASNGKLQGDGTPPLPPL